jgi:hypothetical protein
MKGKNMIKALKMLAVSTLALGAGSVAQAADLSGLFGNTMVWYAATPDGGERKAATFKFREDGTVLASHGKVSQEGKWEDRGDLICTMVVEGDGTPEDLCSPTANLDGAKPGSEWSFTMRETMTIRAELVAGLVEFDGHSHDGGH